VGTLSIAFRLTPTASYNEGESTAELEVAGTIELSGDDALVSVELTAAETATLSPDPTDGKLNYRYHGQATREPVSMGKHDAIWCWLLGIPFVAYVFLVAYSVYGLIRYGLPGL
jgi:hypothetical protein